MRCWISIIAILGQFAIQLASVPHCHAGMSLAEQQKHDAVPHFHCQRLAHSHGHRHGQSHDDCRHRHQPSADRANHATLRDGGNTDGHDADAIYCPGSSMAVSDGQHHVTNLSLLTGAGTLAPCQLLAKSDSSGDGFGRGQPSDREQVFDGSDIYLTTRNLRL
jgi:hypothetical protein